MKTHHPEKLLLALLEDSRIEALRQASLASGLDEVRATSLRRKLARSLVLASAPLALIAALFSYAWAPRSVSPAPQRAALSAPPTPALPAPHHTALPAIEPIEDRELLALFPNQTVAIVGPPGHQQFLVLSERPEVR